MSTLPLIITTAGLNILSDANSTGTTTVVLSEIALGAAVWTPDATATALQAEFKRINTIGGLAVADDTLHITITDDSADAYDLGEFGIYLDTGELFAIYSPGADTAPITAKAADALLLLAADVVVTSESVSSVTVNGIGFSNPAATESLAGIAEIATQAEVDAGTDDERFITPLKAATRYQPKDAELTALSALVSAADKLPYFTGSGTASLTTLSSFVRTLLDDTSAAGARSTLGAQEADSTLSALAAVVTAADKLIYATGSDTFSTTTISAFARSLLDDTYADEAQETLKINLSTADFSTLMSSALFPGGLSRFYSATGGSFTGSWMNCITVKSAPTRGFQIAVDHTDATIMAWRNTASDGLSWQPWQSLTSSTLAAPNSLILRDSAGRAKVAAPTAPDDIARLDNVVYVASDLHEHLNQIAPHSATSAIAPNYLMLRDAFGRAKVEAPSAGDDIARKDTVEAAKSAAGTTGEVAFFAKSTAPTGWLKANGATVSRTTYAALFSAIGTNFGAGDGATTFRIPDLRGEFPRGWDDARGIDSGRAFASSQTGSSLNNLVSVAGYLNIYDAVSLGTMTISAPGVSVYNRTATRFEIRPRNIALLACIKY